MPEVLIPRSMRHLAVGARLQTGIDSVTIRDVLGQESARTAAGTFYLISGATLLKDEDQQPVAPKLTRTFDVVDCSASRVVTPMLPIWFSRTTGQAKELPSEACARYVLANPPG